MAAGGIARGVSAPSNPSPMQGGLAPTTGSQHCTCAALRAQVPGCRSPTTRPPARAPARPGSRWRPPDPRPAPGRANARPARLASPDQPGQDAGEDRLGQRAAHVDRRQADRPQRIDGRRNQRPATRPTSAAPRRTSPSAPATKLAPNTHLTAVAEDAPSARGKSASQYASAPSPRSRSYGCPTAGAHPIAGRLRARSVRLKMGRKP